MDWSVTVNCVGVGVGGVVANTTKDKQKIFFSYL